MITKTARAALFVVIGALLCGAIFIRHEAVLLGAEKRATDHALRTAIVASYARAEEWLVRSQSKDGDFMYLYDVASDKRLAGNNPIRQLMASRLFAELSHERPKLHGPHLANVEYVLTSWYHVSDSGLGYILFDGSSKLGSNATALRMLTSSPFFERYEVQATALAKGILHLAQPDGSLIPWFVEPDYPYNAKHLMTFYSGEAILALVEFAARSGDVAYLKEAMRIQDYYLDTYVRRLDINYYPAYVPWHTMSLTALYRASGNADYANAVFRLTDKLLELQDRTEFPGRFYSSHYPQYGAPHTASDGVYTEGLAYAYQLAIETGRRRTANRYRVALHLGVRNLLSLQVHEYDEPPSPNKAVGAFRINASDARIRLDNTQHTMDAFRKILQVL